MWEILSVEQAVWVEGRDQGLGFRYKFAMLIRKPNGDVDISCMYEFGVEV